MSKNSAPGEDVLFHEMYNVYYHIVAHLIKEGAGESPLSLDKIKEFIKKFGFGETEAEFFKKLCRDDIPVFCKNDGGTYATPLNFVARPLSLVERRWLASIAEDERMGLFMDDGEITTLKASLSLGGADPLYRKEHFHVIDGVNDPDQFSDETYKKNFRAILGALRHKPQKKSLRITYKPRGKGESTYIAEPSALQYSCKDDKFRLLCSVSDGENAKNVIMNVSRITDIEILDESPLLGAAAGKPEMITAVMKLLPGKYGAPERAVLHFANYECSPGVDEEGGMLLNVKYNAEDEMELLIRVLSFGPLVRVLEPASLAEKVVERLRRQAELNPFRF